ncbi:hypothetical protein F5Y15DRAFT_51847 [Xylariaceae sp. FL0016]|nr:hypothetical protein F5Y15DRAFT_51847 [Xylariaceae sp. FL0016]
MFSRLCSILALSLTVFQAVSSTKLNITAITAVDGVSRFECWQLSTPFTSSTQPGLIGSHALFLGDVANMTYTVVSSGFQSGLHAAPYNQWFFMVNGIGVISLPDENSTTITAGNSEPGLLFAADTAEFSTKGHDSYNPGLTENILLQIPTAGGEIPDHEVLFDNQPCTVNEIKGLRDWAVGS